jgi:hypothetical protein
MLSRQTPTAFRLAIVSTIIVLAVAIASATRAASNSAACPGQVKAEGNHPAGLDATPAADANEPTGTMRISVSAATSDTSGPTGAGLSPASGSIGSSGAAGPTGSGLPPPTGTNGQSGSIGPTGATKASGNGGSLDSSGPTGQGKRP